MMRPASDTVPLVSVFTPTYRTGERIHRTYRSLQRQRYARWEWVVRDDSDDGGATRKAVEQIAAADARVIVSSSPTHNGKIGAVKREACELARGEMLVELDHDDELTPDALTAIVDAFAADPETGFVYSDCALVDEATGRSLGFGDRWAFGYGSQRIEQYDGRSLLVMCTPPINAATVRHIVGVPNHVRAWRRDLYWRIGGHDPTLPVADDYDLLVRTFLHARMTHLPKLHYVQYLDRAGSAQVVRNQQIQQLVGILRQRYERRIHERLLELGLPDPIWAGSASISSDGLCAGARGRIAAGAAATPPTAPRPPDLSFSCYGVCVGVSETPHAGVCSRLTRMLPPQARLESTASPDTHYAVCDGIEQSQAVARWTISRDGEVCWAGASVDALLQWLRGDIDFQIALRSRHGLFVHAGVVAWRGRAIVIPGRSGSGKTRLVEELVRRGAEYYSDEFAVIDDAGSVHPYARVPSRRDGAGTAIFAPLDGIARIGHTPVPIALLVSTTHRGGSQWRPQLLQGGRAVLPLIDNTVLAQREPARMMRIAAALARGVTTVQGDRPDAAVTAEQLLRLLDRIIDHPASARPGGADASATLTTADVSYVIPTAVRDDRLRRCVESIRRWSPGSEVVIVANGCTPDPTAAALADQVIALEHNLRFAAGANRGVLASARRLVCVMNDDACFVDDSAARLVEAAAAGKIAGPFSNRCKFPQGARERDRVPRASLSVAMVSGFCLMMPTDLFRALHGFDVRLDTWEDDDLCLRAAQVGIGSQVVGGTYVEHECGATFSAQGDDVGAIMRLNERVFHRLHPRIGVIAIARNEVAGIEGFFTQFERVTRAWCLLDTGSSDGTQDVARRLGARVEECEFRDFAHARNLACRTLGGDLDWIVMLDPDERLDAETIRHLEALAAADAADIYLAPVQAVSADGSTRRFVPKPFLFKSSGALRWILAVHEKLIGSHRQALVGNAMIDHVLPLHDAPRRAAAAARYAELQRREPYFTDPTRRARLRKEWPILDYDHVDDPRVRTLALGPLVSVVIPTHRRPELLQLAVRSALAQDYVNLEVVVIGDACPDLRERVFDDPRVRVYNLARNHGAGGAVPRNYGIMLAAGEIIAYLDDDNQWLPDHVSSIYAAMRATDAPFGFSSMQVDGVDLGFAEPAYQRIDTSCVLHRKSLIAQSGWWRSRDEAGYAHDWEFLRCVIAAGTTWVCTRKPTLLYGIATSGQKRFLERWRDGAGAAES